LRIASEREGLPGSRLRHSSIASCQTGSSRKLTTGTCPWQPRGLRCLEEQCAPPKLLCRHNGWRCMDGHRRAVILTTMSREDHSTLCDMAV
jgi:hypothetical protein